VRYKIIDSGCWSHHRVYRPPYYCGHNDIFLGIMYGGDTAHGVVSQLYQNSLTARTIQIYPMKVPCGLKTRDQEVKIKRLCTDLGHELDGLCLLMREIPHIEHFRLADGLKLRKNLVRILESIRSLLADGVFDGLEDTRPKHSSEVRKSSSGICTYAQLRRSDCITLSAITIQ
jgi:hypothetical protein